MFSVADVEKIKVGGWIGMESTGRLIPPKKTHTHPNKD